MSDIGKSQQSVGDDVMIEPIKKLEDDHIQINMSSDDTIGQSRDPNLVQSITENQDSS